MKHQRGQHTNTCRLAIWAVALGVLFLGAIEVRAQATIDLWSISAGGTSQQGGIDFFSTIGEPIVNDSLSASDQTTWDGFWQVLPIGLSSGVDEELTGGSSGATLLAGTQPNPFATATTIELQLARPGMVTLAVYDLLGREVARLVEGRREAGTFHITWRPDEIATGNYVLQLDVDGRRYPALPIQYYR
jgi:hypothetical protein